jgi:hypothetical protein
MSRWEAPSMSTPNEALRPPTPSADTAPNEALCPPMPLADTTQALFRQKKKKKKKQDVDANPQYLS